MSSLIARLTQAKARLFGTAPQEIAVPFEVPCDCGHRVSGIRRTSYQIAACSACQASVYILPVNVYPTNRRVRSDVIDGPMISKVGTVVRDLVMGEREAPEVSASAKNPAAGSTDSVTSHGADESYDPKKPGRKKRRGATASDSIDSDATASVERADSVVDEEPVIRLPRPSFSVRLKRAMTPTRLLALAGVAILLSTGWWTIRQRQMDEARRIWRAEMDRADEALRKRDPGILGEALTAAVKAAKTLQRSDVEVRVAESLLRQTQAIQKMSSLDLVTLFSGATKSNGSTDFDQANSDAKGLKGQYVVFEAEMNSLSGDKQTLKLDFPLVVNEFPVDVFVSSLLLQQCSQAMPGQPLLFAARIDNCQPPSPSQRVWRITLESDSCTLITTEFHASQLGFDVRIFPEIQKTLDRQSDFLRSQGEFLETTTAVSKSDQDRDSRESRP